MAAGWRVQGVVGTGRLKTATHLDEVYALFGNRLYSAGYFQTKAGQEGKVFALWHKRGITRGRGRLRGYGAGRGLEVGSRAGGARPQRNPGLTRLRRPKAENLAQRTRKRRGQVMSAFGC